MTDEQPQTDRPRVQPAEPLERRHCIHGAVDIDGFCYSCGRFII